MRAMRGYVAAGLAVAALAGPSHAGDQKATKFMTFSGSKPGMVMLVVPRKVTISTDTQSYNSTVRVTGGAAFAGLVLMGVSDPSFWAVFGRQPRAVSCMQEDMVSDAVPVPLAECPGDHPLVIVTSEGGFDALDIEPGRYRALFLPGGKPATVTLRFPELSGSSRPVLRDGVKTAVKQTQANENQRSVFSGGTAYDLGKQKASLVFSALTAIVTGPSAAMAGYCVFTTQGPADVAQPACDKLGARSGSGSQGGNSSALRERDHRTVLLQKISGRTNVGWWYTTTGYIHKLNVTTVWAGYTP